MHSTTRLFNQMVCGLLLVANAIGGAALSVPSTTEKYVPVAWRLDGRA
jgi:hypothetical protein